MGSNPTPSANSVGRTAAGSAPTGGSCRFSAVVAGRVQPSVISYLGNLELDEEGASLKKLCAAAADAGDRPIGFEYVPNYNSTKVSERGGYFLSGVFEVEGDIARVYGYIQSGGRYEMWVVELRREGGRWKICEFRPPSEEERARVDRDGTMPG